MYHDIVCAVLNIVMSMFDKIVYLDVSEEYYNTYDIVHVDRSCTHGLIVTVMFSLNTIEQTLIH